MILDDDQNPRVQAHGGAALVNFAEDSPKNILLSYLDTILNKLLDVLVKKVYEVSYNFPLTLLSFSLLVYKSHLY